MSNTDPLKLTAAAPAVTSAGVKALTTPDVASTALSTPKTGLAQGAAWKETLPAQINDSVADKVKELSSQDSVLMQQAKADGLKIANRRGLLNSSMAAGAVQDSTLRSILPIAAQDANQAFQKNMQGKDFEFRMLGQDDDQEWQSGEKGLDRASTEGIAKAQRELDILMQDKNISLQERQQLRDISSREGMAAAERALQEMMQGRDIASREGLANQDRINQQLLQDRSLNVQVGLAAQDRANQQLTQEREIAYQTAERNLDRGLQEKLASWNLKSSDRGQAAQMLVNMQAAFQDSYTALMANPNLDAGAREAQIVSARNLRDKNINMVEQMYAIDLKWTDADFAPAAPVAAQSTKPFNPESYLAANPDVAAAVDAGLITPEQHYEMFGKTEGRRW
ncbi:hypothetical protein ASG43_03295 [Aureimonas sp. Leaf454]|uniref:hypothetical protein n=1 Tax=Aureimonas sp. Leaf454 TaxID=1736381 RepID=UPI0006FF9672|nr:hypothetical protein [Aureimonas sp. Leaf454]KQT54625.1 hypothetical protein ASG43_03295 [Aureimonas sp. Leaf454]